MVTTASPVGTAAHRATLAVAGIAATFVVGLSLRQQLFDSNFLSLAETPAFLAGDHPYRDFFELYGILDSSTAALMQWLVGYRLAGEFARQSVLIVAGFVIATHLALTLSRSVVATAAVMTVGLLVLAVTPLYHHSKLFFFPLAIWVGWRYLDRPSPWRGAAFGLVAAVAFLFRYDYGLYMALGSLLAYGLARIAHPASRRLQSLVSDALAFTAALAVVLGPWMVLVQTGEGLVSFTRAKVNLYDESNWTLASAVFTNPFRDMMPPPRPVQAGELTFVWSREVTDATRQSMERRLGLRLIERPAEPDGYWRYAAANVNDVALLELLPQANDIGGAPLDELQRTRRRLPSQEWARRLLRQAATLVPLVLVAAGALGVWRARRAAVPVDPDVYRMVLAAGIVGYVEQSLFREPTYVVVIAPTAAALTAHLLVASSIAGRAAAWTGVAAAGFAAWIWAGDTAAFAPSQYRENVRSMARTLMASPPEFDDPRFRYVRECTQPADFLFVTGDTPYHAPYFTQRRAAGGHLAWPYGWRSDPEGEAQSLALLMRQSVPIALSTSNPVLSGLNAYPRIQAYMRQHYTAIDGGRGQLLVDTRRVPSGTHAGTGYPCFL